MDVMQVLLGQCAPRQAGATSACALKACLAVVKVLLPYMLLPSSGSLDALKGRICSRM